MLFATPPSRAATDVEHERRIREHLGYRAYDDAAHEMLEMRLRERAAQGLLANELLAHAAEFLREWRVVRPGPSRLERLVTTIATHANDDALTRIARRLSPELRAAIDNQLLAKGRQRSALYQLKRYPPEPKPESINDYLAHAELLGELGAARIDFSGVRPQLVLHLAQLARDYDVDDLRRFAPSKRYALVACFLGDANKTVLDHLVEMHHVYLTALNRRALHAFDLRHRELRQRSSRNLRVVLDTLESLLSAEGSATAARKELDMSAVRAAISGCRELQRLSERGAVEELRVRHHLLKRYLPRFLKLPFECEAGTEPLLAAIAYARKLHAGEHEQLGTDTPTDFATGLWRRALLARDGEVPDLRSWELALAFAVRDALRSGDLYLAESRHHVSFWNLVQGPEEWAKNREQAYVELGLPALPEHALDRLRGEFDEAAQCLCDGLGANPFVSVDGGKLAFSRREALPIPPSVKELRRVIETHLQPGIRIEDLLVEVDSWCGFTREFSRVDGYEPRTVRDRYATLLAGLVAHGTNLGITTMAQSAKGITVDMLQNVSRWLLTERTLKAANRVLVDYHHHLDLAHVWGDGTSSSSDGQRFAVQESSLLAGFYPRYFGFYERAITVYTHVSDEYSVFASRAISCSPREAIYVLDGLLENDSVLRPREHYTDTHGFTEQLFGLCYLLGFSFMPRLKDLADQQLYKIDKAASYGKLDPIFRGSIDAGLVREQWDALVRVAASLRERLAPAHVVLDRLAASSPSDRLAKALTMLGRAVKTAYLLRYMHDSALRDRVHLQLNRGESRHLLARRLFFANQGAFRSGDYEEIMNKVTALSVLSNAVLVWNTVRIADIVKRLEASSEKAVNPNDLARISPLLHAHIIPNGTYHFDRTSSTN